MSLLGPDRLLVGRSVVDRKEARCIHCMQPIKFGPKGEPGVVHSREGMKEMGISGMCETCFDNLSGEPDDGTFLEFKRSADEDEPCPCAGGTATCRGNCPIFDKVAKQDAAQPSQAPVVQAVQAREYPPLPWGNQQPYVWFCRTKDTDLVAAFRAYVDADRASSGATTPAAPFAKDSWQHAVDNQLVAFGRTSQEFANPHEALAWLAIMNMELGQSNAGATTQAVRMLTPREIELLREIRLHAQFGLNEGWQREARNLLLELEQYYRTIPPSGEIGGAA